MGDPLREHALHLLQSVSDRDILPDIIKILERRQAQNAIAASQNNNSSNNRPYTPSNNLQDALSRSFQVQPGSRTISSSQGGRPDSMMGMTNDLREPSNLTVDSTAGGHNNNMLSSPDVTSFNNQFAVGSANDAVGASSPASTISVSASSAPPQQPPQHQQYAGRRAAVSAVPVSSNDIAAFVPPVIDKTDDDTAEVRKAVAACHLFSSMDSDEREVIVRAMDREEFDSGVDILEQDKPSVNRFYVILSGTVSIIKSGKQVATLQSGNSFGELEMMYDTTEPCAATVRTVIPVVTYFLDRKTFKNIVLKATLDKRNTYLQMLQNVPFLRGMSQYDKATLADVLQRADYEPDDFIIKFAERGSWMHIIVDGEVKVMGREKGNKKEIVRLGRGDPVGELEFLFNHPAVADVIAVSKVRTAKMNRKHFEMCMGPIVDNLKLYLTEGNYEHYLKNADQAVQSQISAAEQKLKRTKVAAAGGNVIASGSVDSKGEIIVLDDHTIVRDGSGGNAATTKDEEEDSAAAAERNKYMYRFPLRAVHQQNSVIIGVREDGVILSWNAAAARLTNYSEKDTLGQSIYSLIKRQSDQKQLYNLVEEAAKWAGNPDAYFEKFTRDGRLPPVHCVFSRRDGLTSTNIALSSVPGIVAQPKHIPEMILLVGVEQKQVIADKDLDYGDWIVEQMRTTLGDHKGSSCDKNSIEKLLNEYELLRHRSRTIDKDQLHALNPRQLLGQVVSSLQHEAVKRDNDVSTDFTSSVPEQLFCDTELLPEVLRVALGNCVKHNSGSTIKIRVTIVEDRGLEYLEIAFEDNGPGIPPGELKAFEKPTLNPKSQYANSGLIKLKAAVNRLGGSMQVESVPNHTVVKFRIQYLPSEDEFLSAGMNTNNNLASSPSGFVGGNNESKFDSVGSGGAMGTVAVSGGGGDGPETIPAVNRTYTTLVAEEHAVSRNALCSFLWNRKHAVVPASSTADFLRLVDSCDIVILDPDQNMIDSSVDIFSLLQRLERNKAVVVSGQAVSDETREAHRKAGFITLSKPYSPVATVAAIRRAEETVNRVKAEQEKVAAMRATFQRTNRGEWTKGKLLGKGACGDVYEAIDVLTHGKMAVKMMRVTKTQNKQDLINEIEVMCTLRHPNIIHYFYCEDVSEEARINIFMEFANGGTLCGKLSDLNRPMTEQEIRPILVDIVEGVKYIHSRRFVHCDLKTPNVLFGADGRAKIGDFGTARQLAEGQKLYNMSGTFVYMSPECMGADEQEESGYDFATDIWSIGCIALELITGELPWSHLPCKGQSMPLVNYMTELTEEQGCPDLSNIFDAPPAVFEFIRACLDVNPDKRPTASALLDFTLLRGGNDEDGDAAVALKTLAKAKLVHQLTQFVAFAEPHSNKRKDSLFGGSGGRKMGGFFDSDDEEDPSAKKSLTSGPPVGKAGGFFDSDDEDEDESEKDTTTQNNNNNDKEKKASGSGSAAAAAGGGVAAVKKKKEFWEDSDEDDDEGESNTNNNAAAAAAAADPQRVPSAPNQPKPEETSPHNRRLNHNTSNPSNNDSSGAAPLFSDQNESGGSATSHHADANHTHAHYGLDDSPQEVRASSMAVHGKLLQLLSKVSSALHLEGKIEVKDPLQEQYHQTASGKVAAANLEASTATDDGQTPGKPFVANLSSLLKSHAAQLDEFLQKLEEK